MNRRWQHEKVNTAHAVNVTPLFEALQQVTVSDALWGQAQLGPKMCEFSDTKATSDLDKYSYFPLTKHLPASSPYILG